MFYILSSNSVHSINVSYTHKIMSVIQQTAYLFVRCCLFYQAKCVTLYKTLQNK